MIKEIAIEPALIVEWSKKEHRREFKPINIREEYGLGSPKRMSRYPRRWRNLMGEYISGLDPMRRARVEELTKAILEHNIKRTECTWDEDSSWYQNALNEDQRVPFEVILCNANYLGHGKAIGIQDFIDEEEEKLGLLKLPTASTPKRNKEELADTLKPWLRFAKKVVIVDPYFDANNRRYNDPLNELVIEVLANCNSDNYPFLEIIRKFDDDAPRINHLMTGFEERVCDNLPENFEICFTRLKEKQNGEELHQRYILTELGGIAIDPGFAIQDNPAGNSTYDINLLDKSQYLKRWDQYFNSDDTFVFKDQISITQDGVEIVGD